MLDAKQIRQDPDRVRQALVNRNADTVILDQFLELDEQRRRLIADVEQLKAERNSVSDHIAMMKRD